ncbi:27516_t:CDS:2 [Gigaspora margarita]|uniref:27516_t:CDS:1 n=1 Tax=Gigaspora margarita TaxID=4874 RepID=A0ABN7V9Q1_GIGMA|nr:27516_t:CDS:2 [Gigaspora margarita]
MARCLRGWAKAFFDQGSLPSYCQGKHAKRVSLLDDEDFKLAACQEVYFDSHEQENIKEYRKEWALRIMNCQKKKKQYSSDEMKITIPPERLEIWDTHHVLVTHNEAYFYANDNKLSF